MEHCTKCNGMMLVMKVKKSLLPDTEKKQGLKCSRCGYYIEKQQVFVTGRYEANKRSEDDPNYLRKR